MITRFVLRDIVKKLDEYNNLGQHILASEVCGSYRRKRELMNDIDLVFIPKPDTLYKFGSETLDSTITRISDEGAPHPKLGPKIKRFWYMGVSIDMYMANKDNFECLKMIRTGSKEHNVRMTILARQKGMKLFAGGEGLCFVGKDESVPLKVVASTERDILVKLIGHYVEPEGRL